MTLERKGKAKKGLSKGQGSKGEKKKKKKDLSKVKCFGCCQHGHYLSQCPNEKNERKGK